MTIESVSTQKFSLKMNWILSLQIVFSSTSSWIICSFNETTIIMKIMFCDSSFMTNSKIESQLFLINWISKFETIWKIFVTFTMFKLIISSNLIASKSASCWISFDSIEMMNEQRNKSNKLKSDTKLCLESSHNENMNSTTFLISTTWRHIFMNRLSNQVAISNTLSSMIDTQDWLHSMINMTCTQCYSFNLFMRILSFVFNMHILIILNLNHQHQLSSLSRFLHLNLHQSVNHFKHFALKINTHVSFFYLTILFRINMHVHHHHLRFSSLHWHFEIWHYMSQHRSYIESQKVSSRNCRNWTKFIRWTRNSRIQTTTLISNWESSSINVNVSNCHHMSTWKKRHSCLQNEHYFIFITINMRTSHSINFVSIWRNSSKNQNKSVLT
jgi:hypothetical protein